MLAMTQLSGFGARRTGIGIKYLGTAASSSSSTTLGFNIDIGPARPGRNILVAVDDYDADDGNTNALDFCRIDGANMTEIHDTGYFNALGISGVTVAIAMYRAVTNLGGVVQFQTRRNTGMTDRNVTVFELNGLNPVPVLQISATSNTPNSRTFDTSACAAVLMHAGRGQPASSPGTWTGGGKLTNLNAIGLPQQIALAYDEAPPDSAATDYDVTGTANCYGVVGFAPAA